MTKEYRYTPAQLAKLIRFTQHLAELNAYLFITDAGDLCNVMQDISVKSEPMAAPVYYVQPTYAQPMEKKYIPRPIQKSRKWSSREKYEIVMHYLAGGDMQLLAEKFGSKYTNVVAVLNNERSKQGALKIPFRNLKRIKRPNYIQKSNSVDKSNDKSF